MLNDFDPPPGGMNGSTVVLLNGPPRSGKDTAGAYLAARQDRAIVVKFAGSLKHSVHVDYGVPHLPIDYFEDCKGQPNPVFFGETPRQAYIDKSEVRTKPFLGIDHYGKVLRRQMWREYQEGKRVFLVTDSGFAPEVDPVIDCIGKDNILLVRIHAEHRGATFNGDSRSYIELPGITTYDVENNGSIEAFRKTLGNLVEPFILSRYRFSIPLPVFP